LHPQGASLNQCDTRLTTRWNIKQPSTTGVFVCNILQDHR